jgi:putative endonuclease
MAEQCNHNEPEIQAIVGDGSNRANPWFVYLIRTQQGVLYTGISTDPARRLRQHQGEIIGGAKALRGKGPLQLVWQYQAPNRSIASQWEFQLKKLPKKAKEQLVSLLWLPEFLSAAPVADVN